MADTTRVLAGRETAHRFAQRARAERRVRRRRWFAVGGAVLLVAATLAVVARSSLLRVGSVEVSGARRQPVAELLAAARVPPGTPMWSLDTDRVAARVAALPRVRSARVSRSWPRLVRITITERQPVAVVAIPGLPHVVVDSGAAEVERLPAPPNGLLKIQLTAPDLPDTPQARQPLVSTALTVAVALPPALRARLASIKVSSIEAIELLLTDGSVVHWGSADRSDRKAAVLTALLVTRHAAYDVRAPETPSVR